MDARIDQAPHYENPYVQWAQLFFSELASPNVIDKSPNYDKLPSGLKVRFFFLPDLDAAFKPEYRKTNLADPHRAEVIFNHTLLQQLNQDMAKILILLKASFADYLKGEREQFSISDFNNEKLTSIVKLLNELTADVANHQSGSFANYLRSQRVLEAKIPKCCMQFQRSICNKWIALLSRQLTQAPDVVSQSNALRLPLFLGLFTENLDKENDELRAGLISKCLNEWRPRLINTYLKIDDISGELAADSLTESAIKSVLTELQNPEQVQQIYLTRKDFYVMQMGDQFIPEYKKIYMDLLTNIVLRLPNDTTLKTKVCELYANLLPNNVFKALLKKLSDHPMVQSLKLAKIKSSAQSWAGDAALMGSEKNIARHRDKEKDIKRSLPTSIFKSLTLGEKKPDDKQNLSSAKLVNDDSKEESEHSQSQQTDHSSPGKTPKK